MDKFILSRTHAPIYRQQSFHSGLNNYAMKLQYSIPHFFLNLLQAGFEVLLIQLQCMMVHQPVLAD